MCQVSEENGCLEESLFPVTFLLNISKFFRRKEKKMLNTCKIYPKARLERIRRNYY